VKADVMAGIIQSILREIDLLSREKARILIAIDGRCAAGKSTLALYLQKACQCNIIRMDDFFLTPELRTFERLNEAGGNVDYERFLSEVLIPLKLGEVFSYRPYDCRKNEMVQEKIINPLSVNIIEGAYSCHPALYNYYDLSIFLTIDEAEQLRRIKKRNGEIGALQFQEKWIPLEERYFSAYRVEERCKLRFQTE